MSVRVIAATVSLLAAAVLPAYAVDRSPADLVLVQRGTLPIILTAPHGGHEAVPNVAPRNIEGKPRGGSAFEITTDGNTDIIAQNIAATIKVLTGKEPYLVIARFQRLYIDANRPPEIAFDNPIARPFYDYYHRTVRSFVDEIRANYPAGLLIDVHGQVKDPNVLMRGTQNGRSIRSLLARSGVTAVTGPKGIYGQLAANGFAIFPSNDVPPGGTSENAGFSGGYTSSLYGSHNANGIDAVSFEFGTKYRQKAAVDKSAKDAGAAVVEFYKAYLSPPRR